MYICSIDRVNRMRLKLCQGLGAEQTLAFKFLSEN